MPVSMVSRNSVRSSSASGEGLKEGRLAALGQWLASSISNGHGSKGTMGPGPPGAEHVPVVIGYDAQQPRRKNLSAKMVKRTVG